MQYLRGYNQHHMCGRYSMYITTYSYNTCINNIYNSIYNIPQISTFKFTESFIILETVHVTLEHTYLEHHMYLLKLTQSAKF